MIVLFVALFAGFMIKVVDFPDFWIFMYWLDPLHYVVEGLVTTQFHADHTPISILAGSSNSSAGFVTAQTFVADFYPDWKYASRGYDIFALCLFVVVLRVGTYLCLRYVRHDKR